MYSGTGFGSGNSGSYPGASYGSYAHPQSYQQEYQYPTSFQSSAAASSSGYYGHSGASASSYYYNTSPSASSASASTYPVNTNPTIPGESIEPSVRVSFLPGPSLLTTGRLHNFLKRCPCVCRKLGIPSGRAKSSVTFQQGI